MDLLMFIYIYCVGGGIWAAIGYSVEGDFWGAVIGVAIAVGTHFTVRKIYSIESAQLEQIRQRIIKSFYPE